MWVHNTIRKKQLIQNNMFINKYFKIYKTINKYYNILSINRLELFKTFASKYKIN